MRYCKKCTMPDTRPGITFDAEGVCSACRHYEARKNVDWDARFKEFEAYCDKYRGMNGPGGYDCAVAVSGGKDSLLTLTALARLRDFYPIPFQVEAITLETGTPGMSFDAVAELCRELEVPYTRIHVPVYQIVFEERKEKNPCSLCAKMRRGALHAAAEELDCNKVALGHHLDDAVETFYMNLWREGRIGCFSPVTYLSQRDLTLIRPMLLATEYEVQCAVREAGLPIVKSRCPADGVTVREQTKEFVQERCRTDHAFRQKTLHALQESGIDGWRPVHTGRGSFIVPKKETDHAETTV